MPPLPVKLTNCALPWPAQSNPGCSTGLLTDSTILLYFILQRLTDSYWPACTLPTVVLVPFQVPGVHSASKQNPKAGCHFHHCLYRQQRGWSVTGVGLCQGSMVIHFHWVSTTQYFCSHQNHCTHRKHEKTPRFVLRFIDNMTNVKGLKWAVKSWVKGCYECRWCVAGLE